MTRSAKTYTFFLIYILINFISSFILVSITSSIKIDPMVFNILGQLLAFIPMIFIGVKLQQDSAKTVLSLGKTSFIDIFLGVMLTIVLMPIINLLSLFGVMFFPNNVAVTLEIAYNSPLIISIISICIIPAIFEELLFRGIVFTGFKNLSLNKACIMGGLIFAIAHFDLQQALYTFFIGYIFCRIVYLTKSIWPCVATHFCINFSQLMLSRNNLDATVEGAAIDIPLEEALPSLMGPYLFLALMSIPLLIYLVSLMGRKHGRGKPMFNLNLYMTNKNEFVIEDETVFDYAPQKKYEEPVFNLQLVIIIIFYLAYIFYMNI